MSKHRNMEAYRENGGEAPSIAICRRAINHLLAACDMQGGPHSLSECGCNERNPFPREALIPGYEVRVGISG